jgi:membrane protein implicated in regulation of membrane protease activity
MSWSDIFLLCFAIGVLWSLATFLLGGLHIGHLHAHGHATHFGHAQGAHVHGAHVHSGHAHAGHSHTAPHNEPAGWIGSMLNPSSVAVFLAWFGGVGYVLTRHTGLALLIDIAIAIVIGLIGAWFLAAFLRFLQAREKPLDPVDYDLIGVLGQVSATIRKDGVGEVIYVRDGCRKSLPARSEDAAEIKRGEEVVVTRFEKGIAFVRTWEAMTQPDDSSSNPEILPKEKNNVQ